jgi:hypothetical protein
LVSPMIPLDFNSIINGRRSLNLVLISCAEETEDMVNKNVNNIRIENRKTLFFIAIISP